ncbi:biotin--[acetyl-CoA-carboxylase] ligase [Mycobacterium sp.]|uniref:biotin--[acetyl-CoA-carboxylase] ligase n=1 Tax=Mycobacterium sp. TaxID=1785 RepID=UPI003A8A665A
MGAPPDPPPLDEADLRAEVLSGSAYWRRLDVVPQTGSTNADLLARAAAGEDIDGAVLIAEYQSAGRGRRGRTWSATPRSQLTLSTGVRVDAVPPAGWGWLSLAAGLAVVDAVAGTTSVEAGLKWPNDVLAGPAGSMGKLAGILAEVAHPFAVIGIGLNVTTAPGEVDAPGATSLRDLGVAQPDRDQLVRGLLGELGERVRAWRAAGGADARLAGDYRARSLTLGARVRAELPGGRQLVGTARDVDGQGRLCLHMGDNDSEPSGGVVAVSAGDVVHLR